jgi:Lrp/AsnC family leucine-responsive transcriptional regulator
LRGRIRRLEAAGVILGYCADIDPVLLGVGTRAFVGMRLIGCDEQLLHAVHRRLREMACVRACYFVTGRFDLMVELALFDLGQLARVIHSDLWPMQDLSELQVLVVERQLL